MKLVHKGRTSTGSVSTSISQTHSTSDHGADSRQPQSNNSRSEESSPGGDCLRRSPWLLDSELVAEAGLEHADYLGHEDFAVPGDIREMYTGNDTFEDGSGFFMLNESSLDENGVCSDAGNRSCPSSLAITGLEQYLGFNPENGEAINTSYTLDDVQSCGKSASCIQAKPSI